jgi:protoheme IX farnesyltransferase
LVYTVLLALIAVGTGVSAIGGLVFLSTAIVLNIWFVIGAVKIWRRSEADSAADQFLVERKFFKLSLFYLFALFLAILFEAGLDRYGLGGML